ncbi:hypothetical protein ACH4U6_35595 [Streptomyces netropsis]|uniref:hypothetical protein n=1 Tax=Streptomyces netropsis TaxID=55404 RepID=UPI0037889E17
MTQAWSVCIELNSSDLTEETVVELHDALSTHAPSVGQAPNGNASVRLFVETTELPEAVAAAIELVTTTARNLGIGDRVVGLQVMTEEELDRTNALPVVPELAGISEVSTICGVSKQRASKLTELSGFPDPVQTLASAGKIYLADQVKEWDGRRTRTRGRRRIPLDLTDAENAVLLALAAAGRGEVLPDATDLQQRTMAAVEETYSPTYFRLHRGTGQADDIDEALSALQEKALVTTRRPPKKITNDLNHKDDTLVTITDMGRRRTPSAS